MVSTCGSTLTIGTLDQMTMDTTGRLCMGSGAPSTPTYTAFTSPAPYNGVYATSFSFPGVGVGRGVIWLAASLGFDNNVQTNFSAVTIGGQSVTGEIANDYGGGMWWYDNTAGTIPGTTATLAFTLAGGNQVVAVASGLVSGAASPTPTIFAASGNDGLAQPFPFQPITVAAGGVGVAVVAIEGPGAPTAPFPLVWTGATRDGATEAWAAPGNAAAIGSAHLSASGTPTVACGGGTCNFFGFTTMAASWR